MIAHTTEPSLNATAMPLDRAVVLLRRLGETLLTCLARREAPPPLDRLVRRDEQGLLLPYAGMRQALPLGRGTFHPWIRQCWWWLMPLRGGPWTPPNLAADLHKNMGRLAGRQVPTERWAELAIHWIDRSVGGLSSRWLAEPFWTLAGEMAWHDEAFVSRMALLLRQEISRRVVFEPGPPPMPVVAPRTYWALIAIAEVNEHHRWRAIARGRTRVAGLLRLQIIGAAITGMPGWADFWDQWVICEALRLWPDMAAHLDPSLRAALTTLPLLNLINQTQNPADEQPTHTTSIVAAGWEQNVPLWLHALTERDRELPSDAGRR